MNSLNMLFGATNSYQGLLLVQEKNCKIDFQDSSHGASFDF